MPSTPAPSSPPQPDLGGSASTYPDIAASSTLSGGSGYSAPSHPGTNTLGQVTQGLDALSSGLDHAPGRGASALGNSAGVVARALNLASGGELLSKDTLSMLGDMVSLASDVKQSCDSVKANHERCKLLADRIQVGSCRCLQSAALISVVEGS
jgi:hypothetical protein